MQSLFALTYSSLRNLGKWWRRRGDGFFLHHGELHLKQLDHAVLPLKVAFAD